MAKDHPIDQYEEKRHGQIYTYTQGLTTVMVRHDWDFTGCTGCKGGPDIHDPRCILSKERVKEMW